MKFRNLNSPCMRISTHIEVYEPSEDDYRLLIANSMTSVFVSFRPPYSCPQEGHKHGVSIHRLTFLWIPPAPKISQTWIFARPFECSSSFTSLILDFICWMVLMMVWQWKPSIELQQILIIDHSTMTQHVILHSESLSHSVQTGKNQEWLTFESHPWNAHNLSILVVTDLQRFLPNQR